MVYYRLKLNQKPDEELSQFKYELHHVLSDPLHECTLLETLGTKQVSQVQLFLRVQCSIAL